MKVLNFNDPYVDRKGDVNNLEDVLSDVSVKKSVDKLNASVGSLGKLKNLLNPSFHNTTTSNGVTFTYNGDGTYTLNGTSTAENYIHLKIGDVKIPNKNLVLLGSVNENVGVYISGITTSAFGNISINIKDGDKGKLTAFGIIIKKGASFTNEIVKPMITDYLSATYDDYVPYTGDGDTLTYDVAELKNNLGGLSFSASETTLTITDGKNTWTLNANS